jgi:hypothetical protein
LRIAKIFDFEESFWFDQLTVLIDRSLVVLHLRAFVFLRCFEVEIRRNVEGSFFKSICIEGKEQIETCIIEQFVPINSFATRSFLCHSSIFQLISYISNPISPSKVSVDCVQLFAAEKMTGRIENGPQCISTFVMMFEHRKLFEKGC